MFLQLIIAAGAIFAVGQTAKIDNLRKIPPERRIEHVNRLADRGGGRNAWPAYERALQRHVDLWEVAGWKAAPEVRQRFEHVDLNLHVLWLVEQWTPEEADTIRQWLHRNESCIAATVRTVLLDRCVRKLPETGQRMHAALTGGDSTNLMRLADLLLVKANEAALAGDWKDAYEWNLRVHRLANHAAQQPWIIDSFAAKSVDRRACGQFLVFLHRHWPEHPTQLLKQIHDGDDQRCPGEIIAEIEHLWVLDFVEAWHEWAEDPEKHPDLTKSAVFSSQLSPEDDEAFLELFGQPRYASPTEFRKALRASSPDQEWQIYLRLTRLLDEWYALTFAEAWATADRFRRQYCELGDRSPVLAMFACSDVVPPTRYRLLSELTSAWRAAVDSVVAVRQYRQKEGRLPKRLEELAPVHMPGPPIDPFSGKVLVYRPSDDGATFLLYSVGVDQKDDGGRHTDDWSATGDYVFWAPVVPQRAKLDRSP